MEKYTSFVHDLLQPWKLCSLVVGIGLLVLGSYITKIPDWDIPISFIMALCTYPTAGWVMRRILAKDWRNLPLMLLFIWFAIDGSYYLYWSYMNPETLAMLRSANFFASLSLYLAYGLVLLPTGSVKEIIYAIRNRIT